MIRHTTSTPTSPGLMGSRGGVLRATSVKASLRGTAALAVFAASCQISTAATSGSVNACSTSSPAASVTRPRPVWAGWSQ
ncbi:MAG: hypothetical protein AB7J32_09855 [Pseudonocardia sp.]